ncbi:DUF4124 domain-containing protein [Hydrogenophaga sp. R2]|uniref:DUF4124 domain-containing protein n=1 Tax=Hydrogenophaga sp. R2 TaxID=3132827 RepID=UPI003CEE4C01
MMSARHPIAAVLSLVALIGSTGPASAQNTGEIFTCVDRTGKRHTSDRPIAACIDREQEVRGATGTVRKVLPPSYTREERAAIEARQRAEEEEKARIAEERRRERALLLRYPNQAAHDRERAEVLSQIDDVIAAVQRREDNLKAQRKEIETELEFYQADPSKAPAWLKRKQDDNAAQFEVQKRFLDTQLREKQRINARFDEELARLRQLWGPSAAGAVSPASGAAGR